MFFINYAEYIKHVKAIEIQKEFLPLGIIEFLRYKVKIKNTPEEFI